jgi:CRISPR-associated protein Cas1
MPTDTTDTPLTRVMALHALAYCERLFFLEEVEEIRVADANVYAGRRLHEELADDEALETHQIADAELGIVGKMDAIRKRGGELYPYEHKRGRSNKGEAWTSDRIQVGAYAMLLEKAIDGRIKQGRIRYHRDKKTVIIAIDDALRNEVKQSVQRANELRETTERPPITTNEHLCVACSLAPVCLPEESRKALDGSYESIRLFPPKQEKQTIHVIGHGEKIGRSGETLKIVSKEKGDTVLPVEDIREIVVHGWAQASTQALSMCAYHEIPVHWISTSGHYQFSVNTGTGGVQRRIHQYAFFADIKIALKPQSKRY